MHQRSKFPSAVEKLMLNSSLDYKEDYRNIINVACLIKFLLPPSLYRTTRVFQAFLHPAEHMIPRY
jgi:hypothetical protein